MKQPHKAKVIFTDHGMERFKERLAKTTSRHRTFPNVKIYTPEEAHQKFGIITSRYYADKETSYVQIHQNVFLVCTDVELIPNIKGDTPIIKGLVLTVVQG